MTAKTKRITIRIEYDLYSFIMKMADLQHTTNSEVVRKALWLMKEQKNQMNEQ